MQRVSQKQIINQWAAQEKIESQTETQIVSQKKCLLWTIILIVTLIQQAAVQAAAQNQAVSQAVALSLSQAITHAVNQKRVINHAKATRNHMDVQKNNAEKCINAVNNKLF